MIKILTLPQITDPRGNLTFIESLNHIPFDIKRAFWIYDVPGGETRGGHAYKKTDEFIIALSGSFDVVLNNGKKETCFTLNRSYYGLYVPAGTWRQMKNFSTNSLALVLASTFYDANDYIRSYNDFLKFNVANNIGEKQYNELENYNNKSTQLLKNCKKTSVEDCTISILEINHRIKGNITVVENNKNIPFDIKRVYYLYDVPGGAERGGHAHKKLVQYVVAATGSFDVILNDGNKQKTVSLNRSYKCLKIVPRIWRELKNFSSGSICFVLASHEYDEDDYIRNYDDFIILKEKNQ